MSKFQSSSRAIDVRKLTLAAALAAATVFAAAPVTAQPAASDAAQAQAGHRGHHGPRAGHGGGFFSGSPERISRMVDRMLDQVNGTDAQRTQIKQIATAAAADLKAQRTKRRELHQRSMQLFAAPTVDAAAAESVRQQMVAQHDESSRRMLQAMLDVSRVLNAEQRAKLAQLMQERKSRMKEGMQQRIQQRAPATP